MCRNIGRSILLLVSILLNIVGLWWCAYFSWRQRRNQAVVKEIGRKCQESTDVIPIYAEDSTLISKWKDGAGYVYQQKIHTNNVWSSLGYLNQTCLPKSKVGKKFMFLTQGMLVCWQNTTNGKCESLFLCYNTSPLMIDKNGDGVMKSFKRDCMPQVKSLVDQMDN